MMSFERVSTFATMYETAFTLTQPAWLWRRLHSKRTRAFVNGLKTNFNAHTCSSVLQKRLLLSTYLSDEKGSALMYSGRRLISYVTKAVLAPQTLGHQKVHHKAMKVVQRLYEDTGICDEY